MKNYNEMANDVLRRIGEHEIEQRNRRKVMKKIIVPVCCFCLVALLGIGFWQGGFFKNSTSTELTDSAIIGDKDYIPPETDSQSGNLVNAIGTVKVNGVKYVQCSTNTKVYTPDEYLGKASDFEGTYQEGTFQIPMSDIAEGSIYFAKEDSNVLMVSVKNGEYVDYVIYIREE